MQQSLAEQKLNTPVLIELFTSEGCSSCPPADQLLRQLQEEKSRDSIELIVLSEHVDYWDNLGWPDPFASRTNTERQQEYARHFKTNCYTPQMIVDGSYEFVGSDSRLASQTIARARTDSKGQLGVKIGAVTPTTSQLAIDFKPSVRSSGQPSEWADLYIAEVADNLTSKVRSGENNGRTLNHTAVVLALSRHKEINCGKPFTSIIQVKRAKNQPNRKTYFVCFMQMSDSKKIVAIASSR